VQREVGPGVCHDPRVRPLSGSPTVSESYHGMLTMSGVNDTARTLSGSSAVATCSSWMGNTLETTLPPASRCCPRQSRRLPRAVDG
jgi:hypothetical protein